MRLAALGTPIHAAPHDQATDFVELFYDLVFVFAITRVTHLTAHHLDPYHLLESALVFWLVWWAWTQFTWTLNSADTSHPEIRLGTLIATAVAFLMATSVDQAFTDGALWFAVPYIALRVLGLGLMVRMAWHDVDERTATGWITGISMFGLAAVLAGAYADPGARAWWWLATIFIDMLAAYVAGSKKGWNVRIKHFIERHALIVIIALGESLIVAASAIASVDRTPDVLLAGGIAVLLTCLLWWSYFGWIREFFEEGLLGLSIADRVLVARDGFSFGHFPLVSGIIGLAVGFESVLAHPQDAVGPDIIMALGAGTGLFVGSTAFAVWRVSGKVLWPRLMILSISIGSLFLAVLEPPYVVLSILTAAVLMIVFVEHVKPPHHEASGRIDVVPVQGT